MAEEFSDNLSTHDIEEVQDETVVEDDGNDEDILETSTPVADSETGAHDEKLSTIPEETESIASKVDDVEQREIHEIKVRQEVINAVIAAEALHIEDASVPLNGEPVSSVTEHHLSVSKDDLEDSSSDHAAYVEQYRRLMLEMTVAKHRNALLQKKVLEHFKRRKIDVTKTDDADDLDLETKYMKQLQEFRKLKDKLNVEEQVHENEIEELKKQAQVVKDFAKLKQSDLMEYIGQTADKLHFPTKTFKTPQKEAVDRLMGKLESRLGELSKLQLEHIGLRNRVDVQEERKRGLEVCAGEVLHLVTYEKLRTENQNLVGKVEDRDEQLQQLREKAVTSVHNLAHVRQKAWATRRAVAHKTGQLHALNDQLVKLQAEMSAVRKQREHYRTETGKLRQAAGLLFEPALLRDYEESTEEATRLSAELQNVRNTYYDDQQKLSNLHKMLQVIRLPDRSSPVECVQISIPCQPCIRRK